MYYDFVPIFFFEKEKMLNFSPLETFFCPRDQDEWMNESAAVRLAMSSLETRVVLWNLWSVVMCILSLQLQIILIIDSFVYLFLFLFKKIYIL